MNTTRPLLPLAALLLLLARAALAGPAVEPKDFANFIGPLTETQMAQQKAWDDAHKGAPSAKAPVGRGGVPGDQDEGSGDAIYANPDAAAVNNVDGALVDSGLGSPIPGQLPPGTSLKDINGRRYYCDSSACTQCPTSDCASIIPPSQKPGSETVAGGTTGGLINGGVNSGGLLAGGKGDQKGSLLTTPGSGGTLVQGGNSTTRYEAPGSGGFTGVINGSTGSGSTARRRDEPPARTVSAIVADVVLPAVDSLTNSASTEGGTVASGGTTGVTSVAEKKVGGSPRVRYTGGSFDSLSDINNSKALGDAGAMLGDTGSKAGATSAGRTGKNTNAFGSTKGENQ